LEDFYNEETTAELVVAITFRDLSGKAKELFASYLQGDTLTVERVFSFVDGRMTWKYYGATLQQPAFAGIREAFDIKDRSATAKTRYNDIRAKPEFGDLPGWSNAGDAGTALRSWEADHPTGCTRQRDDGQFFGFKEVGQGYLGRFTRFLFIPAVREAAVDTADSKGSVFSTLMDLVVRSVVASKESLRELRESTQTAYKAILSPENLGELQELSEDISKTLTTFVPGAKVELTWRPLSEISIPLPQADIKLIEDGYSSPVSRAGHGLQRAFIVTMLQHLALAQTPAQGGNGDGGTATGEDATSTLPNLVLAIEEPELYQHPNRQRHLAKTLLQLSSGATPGVAERTQIIYGTHSPLFVGIDRINQIRLLKKVANGAKPKCTKAVRTNLDRVADIIWQAAGSQGPKFTAVTLGARLQVIMTPWMSEGFFADVAVLVEGEDDRAAVLGAARVQGKDPESDGIAVIPCGGKTNLDRPAAIFRELGIPVYLVWDSDYGSADPKPEYNHLLLRLLGQPAEDWPSGIKDSYACFKERLERTLEGEIGTEMLNSLIQECQTELCIPKKDHAVKNPVVVSTVLARAAAAGKPSTTLNQIVERIYALKSQQS